MQIQFLGAARTVTGSCHVIETASSRFSVDCGMHQGSRDIDARNQDMDPYRPHELDFICITHAHIDHTGLLPRVVASGFKGPIYVTPPTKDLLEIMLLDSAHIQEMEAEWENRGRARKGGKQVDPLYTQEDALKVMPLMRVVHYDEPFEPAPGVRLIYRDAGHILGSATIQMTITENGDAGGNGGEATTTRLVFSGDLGRPNQLLISDPEPVTGADYLVMESTYGDRDHKDPGKSREELAEAIAYSYSKGEKVVIPAFAVERSQEILYSLFILSRQGKVPKDMPIYLDSPLAIKATEIFKNHPEYLDEETRELIQNGEHPLEMPNLHFTENVAASKAINETPGPAIVISASGMANAGRIKHHLKHNLWRPGASVVFVGYQGIGTPGRKIVDGAKHIRLFGQMVAVKARVFTIGGFSAHAGQSQMLDWLGNFKNPTLKIFLVHGEAKAQDILAELIRKRFGFEVYVPEYLEECVLEPGKAPVISTHPERARPAIDWNFLLGETERLMAELRNRQATVQGRDWVDQTELRDKLLALNRDLGEIISEAGPGALVSRPAELPNGA